MDSVGLSSEQDGTRMVPARFSCEPVDAGSNSIGFMCEPVDTCRDSVALSSEQDGTRMVPARFSCESVGAGSNSVGFMCEPVDTVRDSIAVGSEQDGTRMVPVRYSSEPVGTGSNSSDLGSVQCGTGSGLFEYGCQRNEFNTNRNDSTYKWIPECIVNCPIVNCYLKHTLAQVLGWCEGMRVTCALVCCKSSDLRTAECFLLSAYFLTRPI